MRSRSYLDFDLLIERGRDEHGYQARVVEAPSGPTQPAEFVLPFSDLELENFLLKIGRPRREAGRSLGTSQTAAIETFGEALFSSLFSGDLKVTLATSLAQADSEEVGLRLRLRLTDVPELANIPWEFLRDPAERRFLALSEWTPLVRYLDLPGRQRPLTVSPPLRILVVVASPIDLVRLDAPAELARLREALGALERSGKVVVDAAPAGTLSALSRKLRRGDYHVFHFIGHGGYDAGEDDGLVAFEDADGRFQEVRASHLAMLLHDHRTLRMAVLNSCEGARGSLSDPYAGTAQTLVRQGVPAVVAMQFEITDDAAIAFSQTLYEAIADGYPVDAAMAQARLSICSDVNDVEWATPVLYLRAPDGRIFDVVAAPVTESSSPPSGTAVLADDPAYAAALVETRAGRWHEVVRHLVDVETRFPGEEVVAEQLKNARRQLQLAMLEIRAESAARDERWNDTQFALERIVEIDPAYAGAADRLTEIQARPEQTPSPPAPGAPPPGARIGSARRATPTVTNPRAAAAARRSSPVRRPGGPGSAGARSRCSALPWSCWSRSGWAWRTSASRVKARGSATNGSCTPPRGPRGLGCRPCRRSPARPNPSPPREPLTSRASLETVGRSPTSASVQASLGTPPARSGWSHSMAATRPCSRTTGPAASADHVSRGRPETTRSHNAASGAAKACGCATGRAG